MNPRPPHCPNKKRLRQPTNKVIGCLTWEIMGPLSTPMNVARKRCLLGLMTRWNEGTSLVSKKPGIAAKFSGAGPREEEELVRFVRVVKVNGVGVRRLGLSPRATESY